MPKRRGRSASGASRRSGPAGLGNIDELLRRIQDIMGVLARLLEMRRGETEAFSLDLETTLSLDAGVPPPPPRIASSPRVEGLSEVDEGLSPEANRSIERSLELESLYPQGIPSESGDLPAPRPVCEQESSSQEETSVELLQQLRDMLKRYMTEVLEITEDLLPPFTQVYYLPIKKEEKLKEDDQQLLHISTMLELSDTEVTKRQPFFLQLP